MTHRQPNPEHARLEESLRRALHAAADSIYPAADGLDRIRAKIAVRNLLQPPTWMEADPEASTACAGRLSRILTALRAWSRRLNAARGIIPGRLGWVRPAAALATGLLVVAAASWMLVQLPQSAAPANNTAGLHHSQQGPVPPPTSVSTRAGATPTAGTASPTPTPSCPSTSARPRASASAVGTASPSSQPSTSAVATPSPSTAPVSTSPPGPSPTATTPSARPTADASPAAVLARAGPSASASVKPSSVHTC